MTITDASPPAASTPPRPHPPSVLDRLRHQAHQEGVALVPLRLFIGIGWLRAAAEKVADPNWLDGASLSAFLTDRLVGNDVALPPYETLATELFLPHAVSLAWLILVGQTLVGLAVLSGALTRAALVAGIFMNVNFLLAGEPNPSAFYIVIQAALLAAGTGAILGLDARLRHVIPLRDLVARPPAIRSSGGASRIGWAMLAIGALAVTGYALLYVDDWSPAGSVHDPAMVLAVLASVTATWTVLAYLRLEPPTLAETAPEKGGSVAPTPPAAPTVSVPAPAGWSRLRPQPWIE